jgi:hypothetical protein
MFGRLSILTSCPIYRDHYILRAQGSSLGFTVASISANSIEGFTKTSAPLTAEEFRGSTSYWNSMTGIDSRRVGDRPWY